MTTTKADFVTQSPFSGAKTRSEPYPVRDFDRFALAICAGMGTMQPGNNTDQGRVLYGSIEY